MTGAYILFGIIALASYLVSQMLQSKFKKFAEIPMRSGMTGKDIAEKMLRDNGITDVKVISVSGMLTDHYNPSNQTVNLSEAVYNQCSVSAAAVAAHECGHAVQHATSYKWITMRSKLVPIVSFSSKWVSFILLAGIATIQAFPQLMLVGICLFGLTTLFSFITLPVEFNASARALEWLKQNGETVGLSSADAKEPLKWAAMTYVVAALSSLATLVYYLMIFLSRRR